MKRIMGTAAIFLCLSGILPALSSQQKSHMIAVMLYKTPPSIVSVIGAGPDGNGGITGTQIGGMVTSQFPKATVLLKLGGPADFNDEKIRSVIKNNFVFKCGDALSEGLPADFFGKRIFIYENGIQTKSGTGTITTDQSDPLSESTELKLSLISRSDENWILALKYELAPSEDSKNSGKAVVLLDQAISLKTAEPILVGFPYLVPKKGKFIYWLALSVDELHEGLIR